MKASEARFISSKKIEEFDTSRLQPIYDKIKAVADMGGFACHVDCRDICSIEGLEIFASRLRFDGFAVSISISGSSVIWYGLYVSWKKGD